MYDEASAIQSWIPRYISRCLGVRGNDAHRIWREINEWIENPWSPSYQSRLCSYQPSILLPVAHILVAGWPGYQCIGRFSDLAQCFGFDGLGYVSQLMDGLDSEYAAILRRGDEEATANLRRRGVNLERDKLVQQRFLALWLASATINNLLSQSTPLSLEERAVYSSIVIRAERLLRGAGGWPDVPGASFAKSELQSIVRRLSSAGL